MFKVEPGMIGIYGKTHVSLDRLIDLSKFDALHLDILKGIAISKPSAIQGQFFNPTSHTSRSYRFQDGLKPMFEAYAEFMDMPGDDPFKILGLELRDHHNNAFAEFLKYGLKAHDHYTVYNLWQAEPGWRLQVTLRQPLEYARDYFPSLVAYIENLVVEGIFTQIGRAYILTIDSFGISFEHRDPPSDPESSDIVEEFIHFRPNLDRPFYVFNPETNQKFYMDSRVNWWNDKDTHGGDSIPTPEYALRVDGIFTDEFRKKIKDIA